MAYTGIPLNTSRGMTARCNTLMTSVTTSIFCIFTSCSVSIQNRLSDNLMLSNVTYQCETEGGLAQLLRVYSGNNWQVYNQV